MPLIEPVPVGDLDPEVAELIWAGRESRMLSTDVPPRIWAYRPGLAAAQLRLYAEIFDHSVLDKRLLELVRLRIAALNDCRACRVARKSDDVTEEEIACLASDDPRFSARERAAIRFAELFALDHDAIGEDVFAELAVHFSNEEIVELGLYSALMLGNGRFAYITRAWGDDKQEPLLRYQSERV
jgi:AhpD family alkylhydroperoxidase